MSTFTVTIGADTFEIYGGLAALTTMVNGRSGDVAQAWRDLSPDDQARSLNDATQYLDGLEWLGVSTGVTDGTTIPPGEATTLQWPRSGVALSDGTVVDATVVPPEIVRAAFELALLVSDDPDVLSDPDTGSNLQEVDAGGGVGVIYFNPTSAAFGTASTLPTVIARLVGKFMSSSAGAAGTSDGGYAGNGDCESRFDDLHRYNRWRPF